VERGVELVGNAGEALKSIFASVSGISEHVSDIAASAQEQSTGLDEINAAMGQLDQVTQQNVAMFEETTAASQALSEASEELASAVAQFKVSQTETESAKAATPAPLTAHRATGTDDIRKPAAEHHLDQDWVDF
jgi:methyl-accepting chemotaxis protein